MTYAVRSAGERKANGGAGAGARGAAGGGGAGRRGGGGGRDDWGRQRGLSDSSGSEAARVMTDPSSAWRQCLRLVPPRRPAAAADCSCLAVCSAPELLINWLCRPARRRLAAAAGWRRQPLVAPL